MISPDKIIPYLLKPDASMKDVENLCAEAKHKGFSKICLPPPFVKSALNFIANVNISVCTVIGYPFGYSAVEAKVAEVVLAIVDGADELNIMINTTALKNNDWQYLALELNSFLTMIKSRGKILNIILETALLTDDEISRCCDLYGIAGIDSVITSSGFLFDTASVARTRKMRAHLADQVNIIAVLNANNYTFAADLLNAGASYVMTEVPISRTAGELKPLI